MSAAVGIDVGGTSIKAVALSDDGVVLGRRAGPTRAEEGHEAVFSRIADLVVSLRREVAETGSASAIDAVGVAVPGVLDSESGTVEFTVALTPEWNGLRAGDELTRRLGVPVSMMNDSQAATLAEHAWGAGRDHSDFVAITIGTGIGGGVVLDGQLYGGSRGMAGLVGHITVDPQGPRCGCGNRGCLEVLASGTAIARAAKQAVQDGDADLTSSLVSRQDPTPADVARAAADGSASARRIFEHAGRHVGIALANAVCLLNPTAAVVGGGVSQVGEVMLAAIRHEVTARTTVLSPARGAIEVVQSALGSDAGAIGSATWALRRKEARHE